VVVWALLVPYFDRFEIDIVSALSSQLVTALERLDVGPLSTDVLNSLDAGKGVYQLFHKGALVYVGKAESLKKRLEEHREKISGRRNIEVDDMGFKCLYVHPNWTALAPEDALIKYHRNLGKGSCPWNGNGFGPHDPGRERETTNKRVEGFDATYKIRDDWPCSWIKPGEYIAFDLLKSLKQGLPYLLRFAGVKPKSTIPHPDLLVAKINIPREGIRARDLLTLVASELPGWQATVFPGHMILYKEHRQYEHGETIWPLD
jgi:hypothetical protein